MATTGVHLSGDDVEALARSWRGGVGAGALLMNCAPAAAEVVAGPGTAVTAAFDGRAEVRAARDGTPHIDGVQVSVDPFHTITDDLGGDPKDVSWLGGLRIEGSVAPGRIVRATGDLAVERLVDRAELHAGRRLVVEGTASGAVLHAGSATTTLQRVHRTARDAADQLELMGAEVRQLAEVVARVERPAALLDMIWALVERRHPDLPAMVTEVASALADTRRDWPEMFLELGPAFDDVARLLGTGSANQDIDAVEAVERCASVSAAAVPRRRPDDAGLSVSQSDRCTLVSEGSVRLTGRGARESTISAEDDVFAVGSACEIRSGSVQVGGVMRARELAGADGSWLRVEFDQPRPIADLLRAEIVQAGVEVVVAGRSVRFDRRRDNVTVGLQGGQVSVASD